jgi:hypothetical protein
VVSDLPTGIPNANLADSNVTMTTGTGLTAGGSLALGSSANLAVSLPSGSNALGTLYNVTGLYGDTGGGFALPRAGTFLLLAQVRGDLELTSGTLGFISAKLHENTIHEVARCLCHRRGGYAGGLRTCCGRKDITALQTATAVRVPCLEHIWNKPAGR